jgi:hypothetical protein
MGTRRKDCRWGRVVLKRLRPDDATRPAAIISGSGAYQKARRSVTEP